ncbi:cell wall anchor protein [Myxococcus fulvus]|uniref:cell wall anchor protein n=1 Tax=Myxococcus fulvus TaxID=33 RepID=UPI0020BD8FBE|nr:cell wall anchor protein [Myxococcus fulvus]MCK8504205.1 cell wall anchor protein [Myxococcus fulvus]
MTPFRSLWVAAALLLAACETTELAQPDNVQDATTAQGLSTLSVRGTTSASGLATTTLSIPTPVGTAAGDVLVVQLSNREAVAAIATPPAGWTLLRSEQSASAIKSWLFLRVASAAEPSSHTFTLDLASAMAATLVAVSGADPLQPIDVHVGQKNGNSASLELPVATTSSANGLAVWFSAQVWGGTACPAVHTPPTGFTEQLDTCLVSSTRGVLHSAATSQLGAAGAQPAFTGTSTLPNTNITHAVVLRPLQPPTTGEITLVGTAHASGKTVTSLTLSTPTGVAAGHVLLAHLANRNQIGAEITPPAGWTLVRTDMSSWSIRGWVFVRVATASEPASHTFQSSIASYLVGSIVAYAGVNPANPIDTHAGKSNSGSTAFTTPQLSTSTAGGAAVWFGAQAWTGAACPTSAIEPPAGFTETYDTCLVSSSQGLVFNAALMPLTGAGLLGPFNGSSTFAETNVAQVVALRRAEVAPPSGVALRGSSRNSGLSLASLSIPKPSGTAANDALIARVIVRNNISATVTPPAGWTFLRSEQSAFAIRTWIFYRVAGASEPASYTFGLDATTHMAGSVEAFSGVDPVQPIDVHAGQKNGDSASFTVPDVVTGSAGGLAVWYGSQVWPDATCPATGIEPPLGFAEAFDACLGHANGLLFNAAYRSLTAPGLQTGLSGSSAFVQTNTAHVVVLRAANAPTCVVGDTYATTFTLQGTVTAPEIVEPSGLAASRVVGNALYVHNEDTTAIVAINTLNASTLGTFNVTNVTPADWEDIATGPCPSGSCIFIGDIGKWSANFPPGGTPTSFTIYRVPEPDLANGQTSGGLVAEAFPFVYPDGAKDAESLMVHPTTGDIYVVTKDGGTGKSGVYKFPRPLTPGVQATLIHVHTIQLPLNGDANFSAATAAAIHPCADRFLLRTYRTVYEFRATPGLGFESAIFATPVTLTDTTEGQGEAMEYEANGASYFTMSESPSPFRLKRVPLR